MYTDFPLAMQLYSTFMNGWCGAYWQYYGLTVIPTVSWSTVDSFEFCFSGIEKGSIVAVSTVGILKEETLFMDGYYEMEDRIQPEYVYCLGKSFKGMKDNVYFIDYQETLGRK